MYTNQIDFEHLLHCNNKFILALKDVIYNFFFLKFLSSYKSSLKGVIYI